MRIKNFLFGNKSKAINTNSKQDQEEYIIPRPPPVLRTTSVSESWQFLNRIIANVNKLPKRVIDQIHTIGRDLNESGVKYQHVVELGVIHNKAPETKKNVTEITSRPGDEKRGR